ncbi:MAG: prepilin-type N-terminal cleavage/methylation domain-containing protein [Sedimentisphaerales bacterium]|nr:prepilin-type N-terminal cleavage/methylation domain-containing protein [Sedimentisphaerales bacterium]
MKTKKQKGFTLIELTIATFTSAIVIVAAGTILFFGQKTWNSTWNRTNLQRDASYAMLRMTRDIKAGISAQSEDSGKGLRIYNNAGWKRFYTALGGTGFALKSVTSEGDSETVIEDNLNEVTFQVSDNTVAIDLKLKEDNLQTHFASTVLMRNYGK